MNDLDRQIAELKGMKDPAKLEGLEVVALIGGDYSWSTSDTKALELVDELPQALFFLERFGVEVKTWRAVFQFRTFMKDQWRDFEGKAPTRPEAICRAYIAAKEFLNQKEGKV